MTVTDIKDELSGGESIIFCPGGSEFILSLDLLSYITVTLFRVNFPVFVTVTLAVLKRF